VEVRYLQGYGQKPLTPTVSWLSCQQGENKMFGPIEPPNDPRIFNHRRPDGTFPPLSEFFDKAIPAENVDFGSKPDIGVNVCPACLGTGYIDGSGSCEMCDGVGLFSDDEYEELQSQLTKRAPDICPVCGGDGIQNSGVRGQRPCIACDGTGQCG
jgi:hypothetical protein